MLEDVVAVLRCPHDAEGLARVGERVVGCRSGHRFDVARQGYVNLLLRPPPAGAETAEMVAARHAFLARGHHDPVIEVLSAAVIRDRPPATSTTPRPSPARPDGVDETSSDTERPALVVDLGAGTGHHLAAVLDRFDGATGLALDISKHAARRASGAHRRLGAVVADVWDDLPIRDAVADAVLSVFAPRNAPEIGRILRPGGRLLVVTPTPEHLAPLVDRLGLLRVDADKTGRLDDQLSGVVVPVDRQHLTWRVALDHGGVLAAVGMGPSAWHVDPEDLARRVQGLPDPIEVTLSVVVSTYRRPPT